MIAGYLLNAQTRRRRDLETEKKADASGLNAADSDHDDLVDSGDEAVASDEEEDNSMEPIRTQKSVTFRVESDPEADDEGELSRSYVKSGRKDYARGKEVCPYIACVDGILTRSHRTYISNARRQQSPQMSRHPRRYGAH
jgi:hypothetical protein